MKIQYLVCEEYAHGEAAYSNIGRIIKKFKHENDAIAFVEDDKNYSQYDGLSLYMSDSAGNLRRWSGRHWEACSCG